MLKGAGYEFLDPALTAKLKKIIETADNILNTADAALQDAIEIIDMANQAVADIKALMPANQAKVEEAKKAIVAAQETIKSGNDKVKAKDETAGESQIKEGIVALNKARSELKKALSGEAMADSSSVNTALAEVGFRKCIDSKYGLDTLKFAAIADKFTEVTDENTHNTFHTPWKSIEVGRVEPVDAVVRRAEAGFSADKLQFVTDFKPSLVLHQRLIQTASKSP